MFGLIRPALAAVATTALALTLTATPAEAAKQVKSKVTIDSFELKGQAHVVFHGKVKAKKPICRKARKVVLRQTDDKVRAGAAKTNKAGKWKVRFHEDAVNPGGFKATVKKKVVKKKGKKFVCKAAKVKKKVVA